MGREEQHIERNKKKIYTEKQTRRVLSRSIKYYNL